MRARIATALASLLLLSAPFLRAAESPPASLQTGADLFDAGDPDGAARFFAAVGPGPDRAWADYYLGRLHFDSGEWDAAIERLSAAVEGAPERAMFHRWLGHAYVEKINVVNAFKKMGVAKNARTHFEEAVRLAPADLDARDAWIGYLTNAPAIAGGSREKAEAQIAEFMKISPEQGHVLRGRMHFNESEWPEAEAAYSRAIEVDPENAEVHYNLGFSRQQQENYSGAAAAFEKALAIDPGFSAALYQIGRSAAFSGENLERAVEALQAYLARPVSRGEPGHEHAHWRLGMVYEQRGETELAANAYRSALTIDPSHKEAKKALAKLE